jgi:hypothetical protein
LLISDYGGSGWVLSRFTARARFNN